MLLDVRLGKASGFVTQSFVKAELLVSVVKVNSDPVFTQIGGGGGGLVERRGLCGVALVGGGWAEMSTNGFEMGTEISQSKPCPRLQGSFKESWPECS